jgi:hypothetical protein
MLLVTVVCALHFRRSKKQEAVAYTLPYKIKKLGFLPPSGSPGQEFFSIMSKVNLCIECPPGDSLSGPHDRVDGCATYQRRQQALVESEDL